MSRFQVLLDKYLDASLSEDELKEFLILLPANQGILENKVIEDLEERAFDGMTSQQQRDRMFKEIIERKNAIEEKPSKLIFFTVKRVIAAAAVICCLASGIYLLTEKKTAHAPVVARKTTTKNHIVPGGNHAMLTLSNGATILLDNAKNGNLIEQGKTKVVKEDNGKLAYYNNSDTNNKAIEYNTISTPRGGQYEIKLSDGTHVWLNAASSLKFPTTFTGNNRRVELSGEAYFEVAKNKSMPFEVMVLQTKVTVLGTHFNINAYSDEKSINTTLLEGSVKFSAGSLEKLLLPGQQSVFTSFSKPIIIQPVDVDQVIAWKNGFFEFDNTDLPTIMRQISRWYDVDISYETSDNKGRFGGGISRKLNLSEVLHLLETNGVHFKIEGRKIVVLGNHS